MSRAILWGVAFGAAGCVDPDLDLDVDGLPDDWEVSLGTDPFDPDSDRDGRYDAADLLFGDPLVADHDGAADVPDVYVWHVVRQPRGVELAGLVTSEAELGTFFDPDVPPDCRWVDSGGRADWADQTPATFVPWQRRFDDDPAVMAWLESWAWYQENGDIDARRLTSNNYILSGGDVPAPR
jgi:hypothetical protein